MGGMSLAPRHLLPALGLLLSCQARADALPMWELDGPAKHVRILGSIHLLRPGDTLPPAVVAACKEADVLVMELDLDALDPVTTAATMQRLAIDPKGRTLDVLLGPRDYALAETKAEALGLDLSLLRPFEPWMAAITITQLQLAKLGLDMESGVEQQLLSVAREDHKEVRGLETLEEQLSFMDTLSPPAQRAFLMETLDEAQSMEEDLDDIVTAWQRGDVRILEKEFLDELRRQPELYRQIVVERNRSWAGKLAPMLRDGRDYLVVVGTLHLVGPDSLIRDLADRGFSARQVGGPEP